MRHGIVGGSAVMAVLLSLTAWALNDSSTASAAEQITETIEGDQLIIESTTAPELFTAAGPDDLLAWDLTITTTDPAETISAQLQATGTIPVEAAVYACAMDSSARSNAETHSSCDDPTEIQPASLIPRDGTAGEQFDVPAGHQLRILLHLGPFDTEASGHISLHVTAQGEHLEVSPPGDQHPPSPPHDRGVTDTAGETPPQEASTSQDAQHDGLASTGTTIGTILAAALVFIGAGTYLRRRKTSSTR